MKQKKVKVGLGEAVSRLLKLELTRINGLHKMPHIAIKERDMLFEALNEIEIDLGFDCDGDGIPDTVEIFEQSANTSCCRILKSEKETAAEKKQKRGRRSASSRRK